MTALGTATAAVTSGATGLLRLTHRTIGFYESVANQITKYFQGIADTNSYVVRYKNDLRSTPTDSIWCDAQIDFGESSAIEFAATSRFRVVGNLSVRVYNEIGEGIGEQLGVADVIATSFRSSNVGRISFGTPRVSNVGRTGDNHLINVTCPFSEDKIS